MGRPISVFLLDRGVTRDDAPVSHYPFRENSVLLLMKTPALCGPCSSTPLAYPRYERITEVYEGLAPTRLPNTVNEKHSEVMSEILRGFIGWSGVGAKHKGLAYPGEPLPGTSNTD